MKSGIETVLDLIGFDKRLEGTDPVVTGEGQTDWKSCFGKVKQGVGERAKAKNVVAVGLSGSLGRDAIQIFDHGIASLMTTVDAPMPLEEALEKSEELYLFWSSTDVPFSESRNGTRKDSRRTLKDKKSFPKVPYFALPLCM